MLGELHACMHENIMTIVITEVITLENFIDIYRHRRRDVNEP